MFHVLPLTLKILVYFYRSTWHEKIKTFYSSIRCLFTQHQLHATSKFLDLLLFSTFQPRTWKGNKGWESLSSDCKEYRNNDNHDEFVAIIQYPPNLTEEQMNKPKVISKLAQSSIICFQNFCQPGPPARSLCCSARGRRSQSSASQNTPVYCGIKPFNFLQLAWHFLLIKDALHF